MRSFIGYLKDYYRDIPLKNFLLTLLFTAFLVFLNYTIGIEKRIRLLNPWPLSLFVFWAFYFVIFRIAYFLQAVRLTEKRTFTGFLLLASLLFALKMIRWDLSFITGHQLSDPWTHYWQILLQLPAKLLVITGVLYSCWKWQRGSKPDTLDSNNFYGLTTKNFSALPYLLLLLLMVPVVALAATRPDFQLAYPKVKMVNFMNGFVHPVWPWRLLYEISYGLDFVSIELFFRGFLILGFARFAGRHAILPMAVFYCTIHFGKPLGECISSFFGGLILGVIASRSRTILGGLIVHLGIAWLMEIL